MLFKDIKHNNPIYILDKKELTVIQGKVVKMSSPRMEMNEKTLKSEIVIDFGIEINGKTNTYVINDNVAITYADNLILSTDKMGLAAEIEALKNNAEQVLASVEHCKEIIDKTPALLSLLNPSYKEKMDNEKRFNAIEETVTGVKGSVEELKKIISDFLQKME